VWLWARGASQIWGFSFNISATTEDSDFKIGRMVGFAKAHHKIPPKRNKGRGPGLGGAKKFGVFLLIFMQWPKVSTSNLVHRLGGQLHPPLNDTNDKSTHRSWHGTFSTRLCTPLIFFAMAEVPMYVANKRYYTEKLQISM